MCVPYVPFCALQRLIRTGKMGVTILLNNHILCFNCRGELPALHTQGQRSSTRLPTHLEKYNSILKVPIPSGDPNTNPLASQKYLNNKTTSLTSTPNV